jgi:NhaP-type Na+/H+ or K+/H+ antiporter
MYGDLAVLAAFTFVYSLLAGRLERTPINGPVVYLIFGVLAGPVFTGVLNLSVTGEGIRTVAELTLALVLFTDASNANLTVLRRSIGVPTRLLLLGLPLTILLGFGVAMLLFPSLTWVEAALLATMLAPTDAALGKAVVTNSAVPKPVREGLNVESGLNDGICVPVLFTFLALATEESARDGGDSAVLALDLVARQIGIGGAIGIAVAFVGARGLRASLVRGWVDGPWLALPIGALAFTAFALSQFAGGSGFIACFAGGLAFGRLVGDHKRVLLEGSEASGELFSLVTWVLFGSAVVFQHGGTIDGWVWLYAGLSLTLIRMLPVFVTLVGVGAPAPARLFIGWFGPRGLASIVFGVIVANEQLPGGRILVGAVVATVVLSIFAHGLSANPLSARFAASEET